MLSVHVKQLENFAGTMNFVIFPMFFISSALYPLWKLQESGADWVWQLARFNPFTYASRVDPLRAGRPGQPGRGRGDGGGRQSPCSAIALVGYDPQRGLMKRGGPPGGA